MEEYYFDLGKMSDEKFDLIEPLMKDEEHDCDHPLTAHTGTDGTWPFKVCARAGCDCQILAE